MSLLPSFAWSIRHLLTAGSVVLGIAPFQRPRSYEIYYTVTLKNKSSFSQSCSLILPEPQNRGDAQTLLSPVTLVPFSEERHTEPRYKNTYIVWSLELQPQEEKGIEQHFTVELKPTDVRTISHSDLRRSTYSEEQKKEHQAFLEVTAHTKLSGDAKQELLRDLDLENTPVSLLLVELQARVCKALTYGYPIPGLYSAETAFQQRTVDCGGFDTLFVALCQACGIPARVVCGFWTTPAKYMMHAWAEAFHPSGRWIPVDPSQESLRKRLQTLKSGEFGFVGSDRIVYSAGCDLTIQVNGREQELDILQTPLLIQEAGEIEMQYSFTSQRV